MTMTLLQEPRTLKKTPLYDAHLQLQAKMVDFSGWSLPIQYTSILAEHLWVRGSCGFFDVSHLGEFRVRGAGALDYLQNRLTCDVRRATAGRIVYGILCDDQGRAMDDILVYGCPDEYYLIVNAANIEKDLALLRKGLPAGVTLEDLSDALACIAVQGPASERILETLFSWDLKSVGYYTHVERQWRGERLWVSRSGYTGEDGFEIFSAHALAPALWKKLAEDGKTLGALPAGLGARNTLRLEAGNVLFGHELDEHTTPVEAGVLFAVSFDKGDFTGRKALWDQKQNGVKKNLVGFRMLDKSIARDGYPVYAGDRRIGTVTSGSYGPSIACGIGMAFVEPEFRSVGTKIRIEIHSRSAEAEVVKRPFVALKHKRSA